MDLVYLCSEPSKCFATTRLPSTNLAATASVIFRSLELLRHGFVSFCVCITYVCIYVYGDGDDDDVCVCV